MALLCSAALLGACATDDGQLLTPPSPASDGAVVNFGAALMSDSIVTRAVGAIGSEGTSLQAHGFGVFACHTGLYRYGDSNIRPDFMYNEKVFWSAAGNQWTYNPLKYWPNGEGDSGEYPQYVSFFAYAPYSDCNVSTSEGYCIPTFSYQFEQGNPWLTYRLHTDLSKQVDLLYCSPLIDQTKPVADDAKVVFQFKHALACVGDQLTVRVSSAMEQKLRETVDGISKKAVEVKITSVSITYQLTEKGRLDLWTADGTPQWQTLSSESALCTRTVSFAPADYTLYSYSHAGGTAVARSWQDEGHGVFYIPIEVGGHPQTATINVGYAVLTTDGSDVVTTESKTSTRVLTLSNYQDSYKAGRHLYLGISLSGDN